MEYRKDNLFTSNVKMENSTFKKMLFIFNALENGWSVKKQDDFYTFSKKHENKKEVFQEKFLHSFIEKNMSLDTLHS